jgi:hypothetical protein
MAETGSTAHDTSPSLFTQLSRIIIFSIILSLYLGLSFGTYEHMGPLLLLILIPIVHYCFIVLFPRSKGEEPSKSKSHRGGRGDENYHGSEEFYAFHFEIDPQTGHYEHSHSEPADSCTSDFVDAGYVDCDCYF